MDCRTYRQWIHDLLAGRLEDEERRAAERHRQECPDCAALEAPPLAAPPGLVTAILERTSGSPCPSARERLAATPDDLADDPLEAELLRGHLEGCSDCAALSGVLAELAEALPHLAEIDPGEGFTKAVLAHTPPHRSPRPSWAARLAGAWEGLLSRPRLAWEGAYLGVVLLALLFGTPGSPLRPVPGRVLDLARLDPTAGIRASLGELESRVAEETGSAWHATAARASDLATGVARQSETAFRTIRDDLGTFWYGLSSDEDEDRDRATPENESPEKGDRT